MATTSGSPEPPDAQVYPRVRLWRRLAALLYDSFLVVAIWFLLGYVVQFFSGAGSNQLVEGRVQTDPLVDTILFVLMVASALAFYLWFWVQSGQTLGMIAWRIRVESVTGGLITPLQGIIRWLLAWPAFFMLGAGYLWLYLDPEGDALHDRLSGTKVVLLPKSHRPFR